MSKQNDLAVVVGGKLNALYSSGNETQIAIFEALQREKAAERGESPEMAFLDILKFMGAALNEEQRANTHSKDKTVELKAVERSIADNLAASGQTSEEIAKTLAALANIGALMMGGGVSQGLNDTITPVNVPNVKIPDLPDH